MLVICVVYVQKPIIEVKENNLPENTTTNPYHWKIVWYVALLDSELG